MFQEMDEIIDRFFINADALVRKLKTKHIPVKVIKSEYPLGTTDGQTYTVIPRQ